jgi:hypothetical protein
MLIGTIFLGKIKTVNRQWIETKFFIFLIPLYPIHSMYVLSASQHERRGIILPVNRMSAIAGYTRGLLFTAAIILMVVGINEGGLVLGIAIAAILCWVYMMFFFGKASAAEQAERSRVGSVCGFFILPEWIDVEFAYQNFPYIEGIYRQTFGDADWRADILQEHIPTGKKEYLYVLALFNAKQYPTEEHELLLEKIDRLCTKTAAFIPLNPVP